MFNQNTFNNFELNKKRQRHQLFEEKLFTSSTFSKLSIEFDSNVTVLMLLKEKSMISRSILVIQKVFVISTQIIFTCDITAVDKDLIKIIKIYFCWIVFFPK